MYRRCVIFNFRHSNEEKSFDDLEFKGPIKVSQLFSVVVERTDSDLK